MPSFRSLVPCALTLLSLIALGCDRRPDDLREWKASDHEGSGSEAWQAPRADGKGTDGASVVDVVWQAQCALCHGASGRGDGPQGPMLRTPNLTLAEWQTKTSDEQIAKTIVEGKGSMPKFEGLPDEVVSGLVAKIRAMRAPE